MNTQLMKAATRPAKRGRTQILSSEEEQQVLTGPEQDPGAIEVIKRRIRSREWARQARLKNMARTEILQERANRLAAANAELEHHRRLRRQWLQSLGRQLEEIGSALGHAQICRETLTRAYRRLQLAYKAFSTQGPGEAAEIKHQAPRSRDAVRHQAG